MSTEIRPYNGPFTGGNTEDALDNMAIEDYLALPEPRKDPPRRFLVAAGPFGHMQVWNDDGDDDEQVRIPTRRGEPGSTGCAARTLIIFAFIALIIMFAISTCIAGDRLTQYDAYLKAEARI